MIAMFRLYLFTVILPDTPACSPWQLAFRALRKLISAAVHKPQMHWIQRLTQTPETRSRQHTPPLYLPIQHLQLWCSTRYLASIISAPSVNFNSILLTYAAISEHCSTKTFIVVCENLTRKIAISFPEVAFSLGGLYLETKFSKAPCFVFRPMSLKQAAIPVYFFPQRFLTSKTTFCPTKGLPHPFQACPPIYLLITRRSSVVILYSETINPRPDAP